MKKIAVLTSGGDSPGMNAAVRAVTRTACHFGYEVIGVEKGFNGLISADFRRLGKTDVSGIIQRGGTILRSARSEEFRTPEGRVKAAKNLKSEKVGALVVIGGDGSFRGATILAEEHGIEVVGIPGTIDNDLIGSDETIGYDTALNTAMDAIDNIRDTADAHERLFLVEVMGRHSGFIALETGIATGAELIILPEALKKTEEIKSSLRNTMQGKKRSTLVVIAEGEETGGAVRISSELEEDFGKYEMKVCILGHIQRGGSPTARDRVLSSRLGYEAVKAIYSGKTKVMVGIVNNEVKITPIENTFGKIKQINFDLLEMYKILR
ncbi:MAG: 6-phosphofructokinase [Balneolaceae bacterium]|nr:MAG: 6-phosphofructokinase [Balneolaceae bacterium]